nr:hypothetical protein [Microbacterium bovistercoris]
MNRGDEDGAGRGMTRRRLLQWIGLGAGGVVVAGGAGAAIRGAVNGVWSSGQGAPYELWRDWASMTGIDQVVAAGVLAANPHNTQPWHFDIHGDAIDIRSDETRRMPFTDASDREHLAGLGCAAENMVVAARAQARDATVTAFPDPVDPLLAAQVTLSSGAAPTDAVQALAAAIPLRHSDRGPFTADAIDDDTLASFSALPERGEPASLVTIADAAARDAVSGVMMRAVQAIVDDADASQEAFDWFRNDRADIDRYRDGLTLDGQGFDDVTLALAKILPATSRQDGDAYWLRAMRDTDTKTAAAYGIITVDDVHDPALQFAGGRLLERAHLHATALGLGFQHMNPVTERIDRAHASGTGDWFSDDWATATGVPADRALLAFRIGHPVRTARPSPRRALTDVVTTA